MRSATKNVAAWLGMAAGIAGLEHGYFEILQGNTKPQGVMFASMGPPCDPEKIWNACEPAMSILPNFLISGILTVLIGLAVLVWSARFIQFKHGGHVLILLSLVLLFVGGGFFPPVIGIVAGVTGLSINKTIHEKQLGGFTLLMARLWPWPLLILIFWFFGQFVIGYFFNDFLSGIMGGVVFFILGMLPVCMICANSYDRLAVKEMK
jgi:hypothetical protein